MDNDIFLLLHSLVNRSATFDILVIFFATFFQYIVITLAALFLLVHHEVIFASSPFKEFKQKWKEILIIFFSGILAWLLAFIFKLFFQIPRPIGALLEVNPLFYPMDYSFPSGHATFFFALAFSMFFSHKKVGVLFLFFALAISVSRIIAGVHFPIDILGGLFLGFTISFIIYYLSKK